MRNRGVGAALVAALLFGAATPVAKLLLDDLDPFMLAGLLYAGAGLGLLGWRLLRRSARVRLSPGDWRWMAGAVVAGGISAPVLLLSGLAAMPASGASLLLNAESVFTALIAWVVFRENVDRRVGVGMLAIAAGAVVLTWPGGSLEFGAVWPALAVLAACVLWAVDNNLARHVSYADATWIVMVKGLTAGTSNLVLAVAVLGQSWPDTRTVAAAMTTGFFAYGVSLALFVHGLRWLGTARTGAYFAVAPFLGAVLAVILLKEPVSASLLLAGTLMGLGVWLHLRERHVHRHHHPPTQHSHPIPSDDPHHEDVQILEDDGHRHPGTEHSHPHYPDLHHRHGHGHRQS